MSCGFDVYSGFVSRVGAWDIVMIDNAFSNENIVLRRATKEEYDGRSSVNVPSIGIRNFCRAA